MRHAPASLFQLKKCLWSSLFKVFEFCFVWFTSEVSVIIIECNIVIIDLILMSVVLYA